MSESGYSGTPLPKKLGLKPELAALFVGLPDSLAHLPDGHALDLLAEEGIPGSDHHHRRWAAGDLPADGPGGYQGLRGGRDLVPAEIHATQGVAVVGGDATGEKTLR